MMGHSFHLWFNMFLMGGLSFPLFPIVSFFFNGMVGHGSPCFQWFSTMGRVMFPSGFQLFSMIGVGHDSLCFQLLQWHGGN